MKHFKWIAALLALTLALSALGVMLFELQGAEAAVVGPKVPYYSLLEIDDLEASTWYILVDLSDKANFPHYQTNSIVLKQLQHSGVLSAATHWDVHFGVVGELDGTDAYVEWFHTPHRLRTTQFDEKWTLPEHGLNLALKSDDTLVFVASVEYTDTVAVTTTTALISPVTVSGSITTVAGAGDIIMYVEEVDSGGHIDLSVGVALRYTITRHRR